ncbi:alpha-2-macroglobulin-like protein 1 [Acipenser ruthenus]|uniref:alpha-2-macroglobulin-like protein 1 n=1 Tax=Acipenser ruthenus TaxID=7906 RepID=UPI002741545F|nr:alpha-2-macroglobulin-like protein 1 [Acipenser ruthenus]
MWRGLLLACLLLHTAQAEESSNGPIYLVTVPSQIFGGTTETFCAQLLHPNESLTFTVTMETNADNLTLLEERVKENEFYRCVPFQVPVFPEETIVYLRAEVKGKTVDLEKRQKVLISSTKPLMFIQTDKPIYKPGQTVKFRIVTLDTHFVPINEKYKTVELQDPATNRIAQWLDRTSVSGILDLSQPLSSEAPQGTYTLHAETESGNHIRQFFNIKEYVLPKYEVKVHLPKSITILDAEVTVKICAKYTYGKPVLGKVTGKFCRPKWNMYWYRRPDNVENNDICHLFNVLTDKTGCVTEVIDLKEFALNATGYSDRFNVACDLEEEGTGVQLSGSSSSTFTSNVNEVSFEGAQNTFKKGIPFKAKIKMTGPDSSPLPHEKVHLIIRWDNHTETMNFTTDSRGLVPISLDTSSWDTQSVRLEARYSLLDYFFDYQLVRPTYGIANLWLNPFYSKSKSFLKIQENEGKLQCGEEAPISIVYIIQGEELAKGEEFMDFYYLVLAKGSIARNGRVGVPMKAGQVSEGEFSFKLPVSSHLAPYAQVLVYAVFPNGEIVADSFDFQVDKCFKNKVDLKFSAPQELPGEDTTVHLRADPGSLCALRAVDQSIILMEPDKELTVDTVYNLLPTQKRDGYSYRVEDYEPYPCLPSPFHRVDKRSIMPYYHSRSHDDVYGIFKGLGLKILSNSDVKKPIECHWLYSDRVTSIAFSQPGVVGQASPFIPMIERMMKPVIETVRKYFPETWIWELVPVGKSGSVEITHTVPDTITEWKAGAFCTSPLGFGMAPPTGLTAFQPFFVELTLPYSVIRGEQFELKATVFNYLSQCIMVKVSHAESSQFQMTPCEGCEYTTCLCADEARTFRWAFIPSALGEVNVTVSAQALQTDTLCGNEVVAVPERGRIDTVIRKLLVEAEGIEQTVTQNALMCPGGSAVKEEISLKLPEVTVNGSAKASLSVLGDLLGRAMQNLDRLLAMPFGCGEQNMVLFAPNIYILKYLQGTGQLTEEIKAKATRFLESGYQRELNYKHEDGSYSAFGKSDDSGNTWLTAFVLKSFGGALPFIYIDPKHIKDAQDWLGHHQQKNGCFLSVGKLFHNNMKGGVGDEVSLTAYITAALLEVETPLTDLVLNNSLACLRSAVDNITNTYTTALLSYTFSLAGEQEMRSKLLTELEEQAHKTDGSLHWSRSKRDSRRSDSLEVEMTAYVLMSVLSAPQPSASDLSYASRIVKWLAYQQNPYGGFSSTQDTVVALQALARYSALVYSPEGSSTLTVRSKGGFMRQFHLDQSNRLLYQEEPLQEVPGEYSVEAEGKNCVFVQLALRYNIPPPPGFSTFNISAEARGLCIATDKKTLKVLFTVSYNGKREVTNMVIVNVKLLSGFSPDKLSLENLQRAPLVKRVDTEDGHVIIYIDGLIRLLPMNYAFNIIEDFNVRNLKPAVVKIYDYYQTSEHAESEYSSPCHEPEEVNEV